MSSTENEKLLYAATLLIEYAGGALQRTNLNKALFYLDLHWLLERGESFTGSEYVALKHGPVLDDYSSRLINPLVGRGAVVEVEEDLGFWRSKRLVLRKPAAKPDEHTEVLFRRVAQLASGQNAAEISDFSHENIGWKTAFEKRSGHPISLVLALEQLMDEDPWLKEPLTSAEMEAIKKARADEVVPFE